jgi:hypothetical protein
MLPAAISTDTAGVAPSSDPSPAEPPEIVHSKSEVARLVKKMADLGCP